MWYIETKIINKSCYMYLKILAQQGFSMIHLRAFCLCFFFLFLFSIFTIMFSSQIIEIWSIFNPCYNFAGSTQDKTTRKPQKRKSTDSCVSPKTTPKNQKKGTCTCNFLDLLCISALLLLYVLFTCTM